MKASFPVANPLEKINLLDKRDPLRIDHSSPYSFGSRIWNEYSSINKIAASAFRVGDPNI